MATEIERKFLVDKAHLGQLQGGEDMRQGFIETRDLTAVRVRVAGESAWLTIKGRNTGATRLEFEYPIPAADGRQILAELCSGGVVEKIRYRREFRGHLWEIDVFGGHNSGLIVAEVELACEEDSPELPQWIGKEVTGDPRYYNVNLAKHPFCHWNQPTKA